jgi:outer membrane protein assembly factor BamB
MIAIRSAARYRPAVCVGVVLFAALFVPANPAGNACAGPTEPVASPIKEPYQDPYGQDGPPFLAVIERARTYGGAYQDWNRSEAEMKLSSEPTFFTLNVVEEDSRAYALVEAGRKKEMQGEFREALKIYQQVIEKYPDTLYRTSRYGIFVPVSQYCQRRILRFPASDLAHYRAQYDPRAAEAFDQARRQYSLLGLSDILDSMLATSYGGKAELELGNAALDMGHYLAALEHYTTVRDFFPDRTLRTPELALKITLCRKVLGDGPLEPAPAGDAQSILPPGDLEKVREAVQKAAWTRPPFHSQLTSAPNVAADDYTLLPPTTDPMGLAEPAWMISLPGARRDFFIYTQPVVTDNSIIYRHKNIVYCRSILNGELRWVNHLGGRALWQNPDERQYPQEDVLVQDGLVFTVVSRAGPSLVALDEVTGQVKWAYGPMVAATVEESRMRFEAAPTGGPRTVYAGYVLDNIEGETHTDSEYGVIAFESTTGRIQWQRRLCRLAPGKFSAGFAEKRRNRIRSFTSPPLYHQGTVYYNTNAGAVAAIDAMSGRVKWLMRYPYHPSVHDATRTFGRLPFWSGLVNTGGMHEPSFWFNQRPLLVDEQLFVLPVDSSFMLCVDRRSGRVNWTLSKGGTNYTYLLGPIRDGHLVLATSGRQNTIRLVNPQNGQTEWSAPDLIIPDTHPVMKYVFGHGSARVRGDGVLFGGQAVPQLGRPDHRQLPGGLRPVRRQGLVQEPRRGVAGRPQDPQPAPLLHAGVPDLRRAVHRELQGPAEGDGRLAAAPQ